MYENRMQALTAKLEELLGANRMPYNGLVESQLPQDGGVYLISAMINNNLTPYYVGRASVLSRRLYTNHLMGNKSTARLKKYMVESSEVKDMAEAKSFLRNYCSIQWVIESDYRERGAYEGFFTSVLFPKYGIAPE